MQSFRSALLATTLLALPVVAQAQPIAGFYVGAAAGVNWLMETDADISTQARSVMPNRNGTMDYSTGFVGLVNAGYGYGNGLRTEVEFSYRENEVNSISGYPGTLTNPIRTSGTSTSYTVMLNALYDIDLGLGFMTPYIGGGIGYSQQVNQDIQARGANNNAVFINSGDGQFAYQAIIGASFPISSVPGLSITAEYRYLASLDEKLDAKIVTPGRVTTATADVSIANQSLLIGLRYAFGVTPPPPPVVPAAAPAPARTFLVFFDFDRADLTDRARQIIAEAATNAQRVGTTRIEVSGHADTVGTPQYNQALSVRRANAVAAELERRGVARSAMTIQGFGFTRPLVPTGPNVREPQNRRVEIVLR